MAQQQPGAECDENGVPFYRWPPFPESPSGVNIVPFKDFKPSGIQVSMDDDGVELDGEGIPTVRLGVTHDLDAPPRKKKKTKKTFSGEEVVKRFVWWEEWAAGEDLRRHSYNQMLSPGDRIEQALADFKRHRTWPPASSRVQEWFDRFIFYIGLDIPKMRPRVHRFKDEQEEPGDEDSDQDAAADSMNADNQPHGASQIKIEKFDEKQHKIGQDSVTVETVEEFRRRLERHRELQDGRLEAFLNSPELAIKIFFSAYFRDGGMMWENLALRDAPRVVLFFLEFLLRNRALFEIEKELRAAIKVAEKAKDELPRTKRIGMKIPDEFATCLTTIFGSRLRKVIWPVGGDTDEPQSNGVTPTSEAVTQPDVEAEADGGGWSSLGIAASGWRDISNADGVNDDNPWAQAPTSAEWFEPEHSLMPLLGPTTLPISHTVGYVEESTRYVSSVILPEVQEKDTELNVGSYGDPFRQFARVVLKPYPVFATAEHAAIRKPEILEDPLAAVEVDTPGKPAEWKPKLPRHDPEKDSITLLFDPKVAEELARGMGLGGTFVQVIPDYAARASETSSLSLSRGNGGGRGRGRGGHSGTKSGAAEEIFWYAEKILQVIPSFWTEKQA